MRLGLRVREPVRRAPRAAAALSAVHQLVGRLRKDTGISFTLHMLRHSRATDLLRHGVGVDVVARLLTHRSSTTTSQTYIHLDVDDLRAELTRAGAFPAEDPR